MNLEEILDKNCKPKYGFDKSAENARIYNRKDILKAMSEAVKLCNKQNVNGSFVYLHTIGDGEDGNEWQVIGIYKSYNKAYIAKKKYNFDSSVERWRIN